MCGLSLLRKVFMYVVHCLFVNLNSDHSISPLFDNLKSQTISHPIILTVAIELYSIT